MTNDGRILEFNNQGNFVRSLGSIEASDSKDLLESSAYHQAWMPFLGGSEDILVAATQFGDVLDIFDEGEQLTIKGKYGDPVFRTHKGYAIHEGIHGFQDIIANNGFLLALFSGVDVKNEDLDKDGADNLYIWNDKGKPLKHIKLDRRFVSIYPDTDGLFLALDINSDNPLYRLSIPDL